MGPPGWFFHSGTHTLLLQMGLNGGWVRRCWDCPDCTDAAHGPPVRLEDVVMQGLNRTVIQIHNFSGTTVQGRSQNCPGALISMSPCEGSVRILGMYGIVLLSCGAGRSTVMLVAHCIWRQQRVSVALPSLFWPYKCIKRSFGLSMSTLGHHISRLPSISVNFWPGLDPNCACHEIRRTLRLVSKQAGLEYWAGCRARMKNSYFSELSECLVSLGELFLRRKTPTFFAKSTGVWDPLSDTFRSQRKKNRDLGSWFLFRSVVACLLQYEANRLHSGTGMRNTFPAK